MKQQRINFTCFFFLLFVIVIILVLIIITKTLFYTQQSAHVCCCCCCCCLKRYFNEWGILLNKQILFIMILRCQFNYSGCKFYLININSTSRFFFVSDFCLYWQHFFCNKNFTQKKPRNSF